MANSNPLVDQGLLNRLRASVTVPGFRSLNVTASFLGKPGISMALEGESVEYINTMTGAVTSPNPYMVATIRISLLRTQGLAAQYKAQMESNALIGNVVVKPDASTLPSFQFYNCSIKSVGEMSFNGEDPVFGAMIGGYYIINNALWGAS